MAQVTYAAFLSWLLSFTTRLPAILKKLDALIEAAIGVAEEALGETPPVALAIKGAPANQQLLMPSDEEVALEGQVAQLVAAPNAAFDGSRLRAAWKFLNDSGLLPVIISLLTKAG